MVDLSLMSSVGHGLRIKTRNAAQSFHNWEYDDN